MPELSTIIQESSFYEFAALLFFTALAGILVQILKQPLILAFLAVGVLAGPSVLDIVGATKEIELLAKLGIAILLFIVGLKLDLNLIKSLGFTSVFIGLTQIILTGALALLIALGFGFSYETGLLIGVALAFSSTIIVVKLLSDKKEIDSLHGQISLGVLIIQDIAVIISMMVLATYDLSSTEAAGETNLIFLVAKVVFSALALLAFIAIFMRYFALKVVSFCAKTPELLLCFTIAWAILLAALSDFVGLSKELGGLLAGISLASTPFREAIISRLSSLRDFLLLFFFIALGTQIDLSLLGQQIIPAIAFSVFVIFFKPLVILSAAGIMGYRKRTGFLAGVSLAQISEFSLIFITMAYGLGFVTQDILGLITLIALITILLSTYLSSLSNGLFGIFEKYLTVFERRNASRENSHDTQKVRKAYNIILFGLGRYGKAMAEGFRANGKTVLAVDFNPSIVKTGNTIDYDTVYGDASDPEFYHTLPLKKADWVVSAMPQSGRIGLTHENPHFVMLHALKELKFQGGIAVACHSERSAQEMKKAGANLIFLPFSDAAERAVNMLMRAKKKSSKVKKPKR